MHTKKSPDFQICHHKTSKPSPLLINSMTHKQGGEFIELLASQLQNATFRHETSGERLEHALRVSVESLPEGDLKVDLTENLNQYAVKLQRLLEGTPTRSRKELIGCHTQGGGEGWPIAALTSESLKVYLDTLSSVEASLCVYEKLVFCCHSNTNQLALILKHWRKALGVRVEDVVSAVEVCTRLTAGTPCQVLLPWLRFCFEVLSTSAEWMVLGGGGGGDTEEESEETEPSVLALVHCLLHTLIVAHFRKQTTSPSCKTPLYGDLMSGLASVILDLTIHASSAVECIDTVLSSISTILGREELVDAVLQVKSDARPVAAQVLLPLISKVLEFRGGRTAPSPAHFVKIICCCNKGTELAVFSAVQNLCSKLVAATELWVPPPNVCSWLWTTNPSMCQSLGLKIRWSTGKHVKYLLQKLNPPQMEQLLEMAVTAGRVGEDRRLQDSEEGRCLNEQDMPECHMDVEQCAKDDESNASDAEYGSRGIFFMDTAGSVAVETSSGMEPDKESEDDRLIPETQELAQRLAMEDCSDSSEQEAGHSEFVDCDDKHATDDCRNNGLPDETSPVASSPHAPVLIEPRVLRSSRKACTSKTRLSLGDTSTRKRWKKANI